MTHKHEKVTTYRKQPDGSINIVTSSYFEELAHYMEEIEKPHTNLTDHTAKQVTEHALERVISGQSPQVELTIKRDNRGRGGIKIVEKHITIKKSVK